MQLNKLLRLHIRASLVLILLSSASALAPAQSAATQARPTGSITGRVTDGEKGVPNVAVVAMPGETRGRSTPAARATTDAEGRYRLTNVPSGRYNVQPLAPGYVSAEETEQLLRGATVVVGPGETVEEIDFTLRRGGVITGRVTDADGKPIVGEQVEVVLVDEGGNRRPLHVRLPPGAQTDDRGIYRIYGLPPGRYRVSAGMAEHRMVLRGGSKYYSRTFYQNASDEAQARLVEVKGGGEAADIDLTLGQSLATYKVSGRVVDADTGQPVPNIRLMWGLLMPDHRNLSSYGENIPANARGEFQIPAIPSGKYAIMLLPASSGDLYSEAVIFEVTDRELSGVEVRARRGGAVSGVVVVEGTNNRALAARLASQVTVTADMRWANPSTSFMGRSARVNSDGAFIISGLPPGKIGIHANTWPPVRGLLFSRVEYEGREIRDPLEVAAGANVSGVRVVMTYATGVLHGHVRVENGTLPPDTRLIVFANRADSAGHDRPRIQSPVDARGRFTLEGLSTGEYVLYVYPVNFPGRRSTIPEVKQTVNVVSGSEANVVITINLAEQTTPSPVPGVR